MLTHDLATDLAATKHAERVALVGVPGVHRPHDAAVRIGSHVTATVRGVPDVSVQRRLTGFVTTKPVAGNTLHPANVVEVAR